MKLSVTHVLPLLFTLLLGACSSAGGGAGAQSAAGGDAVASADTDGQTAEGAPARPFDPITCKKIAPTGTRIKYKTCKKQSEWDAIEEGSQKAGEDIQRRAAHQNTTL